MKKILIVFFLAFSSLAFATTYYVATNGNDSNPGTITHPFFTLNKAWTVVSAGDTIYMRGGTYKFRSRQTLTGKKGSSGKMINIWAYPGENPNLTKDASNYTTPNWPYGLVYLVGDYTYWKGLTISYNTQANIGEWMGLVAINSNHNKFERLNIHHNGKGMLIRDASSNNLILNCDFHHNYDPKSTLPYGNGDGLEVSTISSALAENIIKGCRIWNNADDGIDLWANEGNVIIDSCWSWNNGYREDGVTVGGDGSGFKFGKTVTSDGTQFKRTVRNCLAVFNRAEGYNQNGANVKFYFYNNVAYKNYKGIAFFSFDLAHIIRNNISFDNTGTNWTGTHTHAIIDHNSYDARWQPTGPIASIADFISIDSTGISRARGKDGSLPDIKFLHLAPGSNLIDAGVNVGLPNVGSAPDLGPFETQLTSANQNPSYLSSVVENATPFVIAIVYNLSLSGIAPSASNFSVRVNGASRMINSVAISGTIVILTLASDIVYGDVVTVAYTKPAINPLQTASNGQAATLSAQTVTNKVNPVGPVYVSSSIENLTPTILEITYDNILDISAPGISAFVVQVNGVNRIIASIDISGNKVLLTLASPIVYGDNVTVSYTKSVSNQLKDSSGGIAESIVSKNVTNNCIDLAANSLINGNISVFPNPAREFINISIKETSLEKETLRIFNLSWKLCFESQLYPGTNNKVLINLISGIYIVQVLSGSGIKFIQKLIVIN